MRGRWIALRYDPGEISDAAQAFLKNTAVEGGEIGSLKAQRFSIPSGIAPTADLRLLRLCLARPSARVESERDGDA